LAEQNFNPKRPWHGKLGRLTPLIREATHLEFGCWIGKSTSTYPVLSSLPPPAPPKIALPLILRMRSGNNQVNSREVAKLLWVRGTTSMRKLSKLDRDRRRTWRHLPAVDSHRRSSNITKKCYYFAARCHFDNVLHK